MYIHSKDGVSLSLEIVVNFCKRLVVSEFMIERINILLLGVNSLKELSAVGTSKSFSKT